MIGCGYMNCEFSLLLPLLEYLLINRYHHLNHHAIFGAGYRSGAVSIMQRLIKKYGD